MVLLAVTTKPDLDNYLDRITEIEAIIVSGSTTIKNPSEAPMDPPFWLHIASSQNTQVLSPAHRYTTFSIRTLLVRRYGEGALGDWKTETELMQDMIDVNWNFTSLEDYRNLVTATYTTIQSGFALDSVVVSNQNRFSGPTAVGQCLGSIHTISWGHWSFNTPA